MSKTAWIVVFSVLISSLFGLLIANASDETFSRDIACSEAISALESRGGALAEKIKADPIPEVQAWRNIGADDAEELIVAYYLENAFSVSAFSVSATGSDVIGTATFGGVSKGRIGFEDVTGDEVDELIVRTAGSVFEGIDEGHVTVLAVKDGGLAQLFRAVEKVNADAGSSYLYDVQHSFRYVDLDGDKVNEIEEIEVFHYLGSDEARTKIESSRETRKYTYALDSGAYRRVSATEELPEAEGRIALVQRFASEMRFAEARGLLAELLRDSSTPSDLLSQFEGLIATIRSGEESQRSLVSASSAAAPVIVNR
ncbi:MAG: hypothetical protein NUW37_10265 [Planctomycetes bacterium]|nr:hypothetical protein [Planctomycetota bacterium]